jgi:hypothetical protein
MNHEQHGMDAVHQAESKPVDQKQARTFDAAY